MTAPLIEARNATKILSGVVPVTLVRNVNLSIGCRELVAITGPSGSGKSSLLYLLGLLDLPTSGDILVDGRSTMAMGEDERASSADPIWLRIPISFPAARILDHGKCRAPHARPRQSLRGRNFGQSHGTASIAGPGRPSAQGS
jgi:energy-coupling factor transporter ATP-binding protein EcfA2